MAHIDPKTQAVLTFFKKISDIPRPSKQEDAVKSMIVDWARGHGFESNTDRIGNLCIYVPASKGFESKPIVVIQGHLDMVCVKTPASKHNFDTDPIKNIVDGDWLRADQTTLGADNGIAIAMAMAMVEDESVQHPPLELLFTIDEETGLTGATDLDPALLKGRRLINIDSETEGVVTIGCAGGLNCFLTLDVPAAPVKFKGHELKVQHMRGGHSGLEINVASGNAIKVIGECLEQLSQEDSFQLSGFKGGVAHNAIPSTASIYFGIDADTETLDQLLSKTFWRLTDQFKETDPDMKFTLAPVELESVFDKSQTQKIVQLVQGIFHGVHSMSAVVDGVVESSSNLAELSIEQGCLEILVSLRSSDPQKLVDLQQNLNSVAEKASATFKSKGGYPAWQPDWESGLLKLSKEVFQELYAKELKVEVIHAGLECGIIGEKCPGMEMISIGPTINNAHSPEERLKLSDIPKVYMFVEHLLKGV